MKSQCWAKMSADLDSNPKVRRAGRVAREVFLFALRRNAARDATGLIPPIDLESWYVADQLQMTEAEVKDGLRACVAAGLLAKDPGGFTICGWDDEWGKRPISAAERQAVRRGRDRVNPDTSRTESDMSRSESDASRDGAHASPPESDCHAGEERREEENKERRGEETRIAAPPLVSSFSSNPSKPKKQRAAFSVPTEAELPIAQKVLAKLSRESGTKFQGSPPHMGLIVDRMRQGLTRLDLEKVIMYCCHKLEWSKPRPDGHDMSSFLRPETLFGPTTIYKYLDPARSWWETVEREQQADVIAPLARIQPPKFERHEDLTSGEPEWWANVPAIEAAS